VSFCDELRSLWQVPLVDESTLVHGVPKCTSPKIRVNSIFQAVNIIGCFVGVVLRFTEKDPAVVEDVDVVLHGACRTFAGVFWVSCFDSRVLARTTWRLSTDDTKLTSVEAFSCEVPDFTLVRQLLTSITPSRRRKPFAVAYQSTDFVAGLFGFASFQRLTDTFGKSRIRFLCFSPGSTPVRQCW